MTDRTHDFSVQPCHRAANNLGHSRNIRVRGISVGTAKTNDSLFSFAHLGSSKRLVKFFRYCCCYRDATDWNAAGKDFAWLSEEQIGRAPSDIDKKRRIGHFAVVVTKSVVEPHVAPQIISGRSPAASTAAFIPSRRSDLIA